MTEERDTLHLHVRNVYRLPNLEPTDFAANFHFDRLAREGVSTATAEKEERQRERNLERLRRALKGVAGDEKKLPDATELELERLMESDELDAARASASKVGRVTRVKEVLGRYVAFAKNTFPEALTLEGLRIALINLDEVIRIIRSSQRAEEALGEQFDLRDFHDVVIGTGSLPLPILEQQVDRFIAERR